MVFGWFRKKSGPLDTGDASQNEADEDDQFEAGEVADAPTAQALVAQEDEGARLRRWGPVLWNGFCFGMSIDDVVRLDRTLTTPDDDNILGDGTPALLTKSPMELGGHEYRVLFYFKGGLLKQITFSTLGGPTLHDFHSVTGALRLKYGREVEMSETPDSFSSAEWLSSDGINISLVCYSAAEILNINFQNRYSDAAGKL